MKVVYETVMEKIRQASEDAIRLDKKIAYIELTPSEWADLTFEVYSSGMLAFNSCMPRDFKVHGVRIKAAS